MTLRRSFDAAFINSVINDERIYPWVAYRIPRGTLDLSSLLADERNVLLVNEGGGVFFNWQGPGLYEAHIQFLPSHRGRWAFRAARNAVEWMFQNTAAQTLMAVIPRTHLGSQRVAKSAGFRATGHINPNACPTPSGLVDGLEFILTRRTYREKNNGN